jgi:hypothetical protein
MQLADLPEGRRFQVVASGETGRLIRLGPEWALIRHEASTPRATGPFVTHIRVDTEVEPLPE